MGIGINTGPVVAGTLGGADSFAYFIGDDSKVNRVPDYSLILTSVSAMCGIVTTGDFFTLYIFVEVLAVTSFALISSDESKAGLEGAIKYFLLTVPASLFILFGIAFLMLTAGTFSFENIKIIIASGIRSSRCCMASSTPSCTQRLTRLVFAGVQQVLSVQFVQAAGLR